MAHTFWQQRIKPRLQPLMTPLVSLLYSESFGGVLLALATVLALVWANTAYLPAYLGWQSLPIDFRIGEVLRIEQPLLFWVNDLWMAVFFFLVGLEIKLELLEGQLRDKRSALVPTLAAIGGMGVPALIYVLLNFQNADLLRGWAIPAATDIAFALGILVMLGRRVPAPLKVLLAAIAIIDDLGAIVIIAVFYTEQLNLQMLQAALLCFFVLVLLNRFGVAKVSLYALVGLLMWVFLLQSGVHATLAGVLTALCVPLYSRQAAEGWTQADIRQGDTPQYHSPLKSAIRALHPWVAYAILPLFAFLNAGLSLQGLSWSSLAEPLTLGIALGLLVGKPIGIFGTLLLSHRLLRLPLPPGCTRMHLFGLSVLCGVGFTMCLFIGGLAFGSAPELEPSVKLGVLSGSLLAALLGSLILLVPPTKIGPLQRVK